MRELTLATLERYSGPSRHVLAESVGQTPGFVANVLKGRMISLVTLERVAQAVMAFIAIEDRRRLRTQLATTVALLREHHPPPPKARPPR